MATNSARLAAAGGRRAGVEDHAEAEEHPVGGLSPDPIGERRPEDTAADIEQAEKAGESRRGRGGDAAFEDFLDHRRRDAEHADAGADVQAQHGPQQPELPRLPGDADRHGLERRGDGDVCVPTASPVRPSCGRPAGRRQPVPERARHHRREVDGAEHDERFPHAHRCRRREAAHQGIGERRADHRAAAKPHDRESRRHAAPIGEPLDERRHRRDVAQTQPASADDAGTQPQQPDLMEMNTEGGDQEAAAPAARRDDAGLPRTFALDPRRRTAPRTIRARRRTACTSTRGC